MSDREPLESSAPASPLGTTQRVTEVRIIHDACGDTALIYDHVPDLFEHFPLTEHAIAPECVGGQEFVCMSCNEPIRHNGLRGFAGVLSIAEDQS